MTDDTLTLTDSSIGKALTITDGPQCLRLRIQCAKLHIDQTVSLGPDGRRELLGWLRRDDGHMADLFNPGDEEEAFLDREDEQNIAVSLEDPYSFSCITLRPEQAGGLADWLEERERTR